jgi:hypothetical protein
MLYNQSRVFFRVPISFHREKIQNNERPNMAGLLM